jgi:hypothetical protein
VNIIKHPTAQLPELMAGTVAYVQKLSRWLVRRRCKNGSSPWDSEDTVEMKGIKKNIVNRREKSLK